MNWREELRSLASEIKKTTINSDVRTQLVKRYNWLLEDAIPLITGPLGEEEVIADAQMLPEYLELRRRLSNPSFRPFLDCCRSYPVIARIKVTAIRRRGSLVDGTVLRQYRGALSAKISFQVYTREMYTHPTKTFESGEDCFVFLCVAKDGGMVARGSGSRLSIRYIDGGLYVYSYNPSSLKWWGFECETCASEEWAEVVRLPFVHVEEAILSVCGEATERASGGASGSPIVRRAKLGASSGVRMSEETPASESSSRKD